MNINLSKLNTICRVNYQQSVVNMFMKQHITQNGMSDLYVRSGNTMVNFNTYSSFESEKCNYISDLLLLAINNDSAKVRKHGDTYEVAGVQFTADQIPKIDTSKLSEIKACNNTIDFGQNKYFKYVSSDGTSHVLFAENKSVGVPYSEHMRGAEYDAIAQRYSHFWRYMMSDDPVYVGLTYSDDDIDEFMLTILAEYEGKKFKSINSGDLDLLTEDEKKVIDELKEEKKPLLQTLKEALDGEVKEVVLSKRLTTSAVCLVSGDGVSFEMERVMNKMPNDYNVKADKILEINPHHEIFKAIETLYNSGSEDVGKYAKLLYSQALLIEGIMLENPVEFSNLMCELMIKKV